MGLIHLKQVKFRSKNPTDLPVKFPRENSMDWLQRKERGELREEDNDDDDDDDDDGSDDKSKDKRGDSVLSRVWLKKNIPLSHIHNIPKAHTSELEVCASSRYCSSYTSFCSYSLLSWMP